MTFCCRSSITTIDQESREIGIQVSFNVPPRDITVFGFYSTLLEELDKTVNDAVNQVHADSTSLDKQSTGFLRSPAIAAGNTEFVSPRLHFAAHSTNTDFASPRPPFAAHSTAGVATLSFDGATDAHAVAELLSSRIDVLRAAHRSQLKLRDDRLQQALAEAAILRAALDRLAGQQAA